jgi:alkylation response protein AidB-like acyl-CoA dehydrogenase
MDFQLTPEQRDLQEMARDLADTVIAGRAAEVDRTEQYPWDNVRALVDRGLMGITVPGEYGGRGGTILDAMLVVEQIARVCGTTGRIVVEGNVGAVGAIIHYGTEDQKRRYLPQVVAGDKPCICITEPEAGSAATDMTTNARLEGDHYVVDGQKRWITGAGTSKIYLIFTCFEDRPGAEGIGGLLAEDGMPGLRVGYRYPMMGLRGLNECDVHFENCLVPRENLLAGPGDGFKRLMTAYNGQRIGAATVALGIAQGAFEHALAYAQERRQFGKPIGDFQGIQWMLADMHIKLERARYLIYRAAANAGHGLPSMLEAATAKVEASEAAIDVSNMALQIFGAAGYSRDWPLERMVRDARMFTIGGGTAQLQRNIIAAQLLQRKLNQRVTAGR